MSGMFVVYVTYVVHVRHVMYVTHVLNTYMNIHNSYIIHIHTYTHISNSEFLLRLLKKPLDHPKTAAKKDR